MAQSNQNVKKSREFLLHSIPTIGGKAFISVPTTEFFPNYIANIDISLKGVSLPLFTIASMSFNNIDIPSTTIEVDCSSPQYKRYFEVLTEPIRITVTATDLDLASRVKEKIETGSYLLRICSSFSYLDFQLPVVITPEHTEISNIKQNTVIVGILAAALIAYHYDVSPNTIDNGMQIAAAGVPDPEIKTLPATTELGFKLKVSAVPISAQVIESGGNMVQGVGVSIVGTNGTSP